MRGEEDAARTERRLMELAERAFRTERPVFTDFLSPAEAEWAKAAAGRQGVAVALNGGYEDAERRMACFLPAGAEQEPFPITALELRWPRQEAPAHRDVLGSVMGLGVKRHCIGDIVLETDYGILFAQSAMAAHLCGALTSAGRVNLRLRELENIPAIDPPEGVEVRDTVSSLRLDALIAAGFGLSRARAAELVESGRAKLRHLPTERADARVQQGDAITVRGFGRLMVSEVGEPTRKGRLPVRLVRFGERRGR